MIANKRLLDFGSGYGAYLRLAQEVASEVAGVEIESSVKACYERANIALYRSIDEAKGSFDMITCFHVLEHLPKPIESLRAFSKRLSLGGKILLEVPNANDALLTLYKSEAFADFTYWSAHLYLFTPHTLERCITQAGLKVEFIKCVQRYPLSNHLYWLSCNKPAGHKAWGQFLDSVLLNQAYGDALSSNGMSDTLLALVSVPESK